MPGLIEKLRKLAFPSRDISDGMNMGEAVRLDQIEETIRQHFAAPEVVEMVAKEIQHHDDNYGGAWFEQAEAVKSDFKQTAKAALAAALGEKE